MDEILMVFDNLLQTEGHRIKFLSLMNDCSGKFSKAVLKKVPPALKTLIFMESDSPTEDSQSDLFGIIKAAKGLENLEVDLIKRPFISISSLLELKPSFERLINLKLTLITMEIKEQFFTSLLPSCYKLESLVISTLASPLGDIKLPSVITLKNLIYLHIDCYALVHKLRAPALKRLSFPGIRGLEPDDRDYLIFDEYVLSPVTELCVSGYSILVPHGSSVVMEGFTGSKSGDKDPWTSFEMNRHSEYDEVDLRRDNIDASSISPTQFYIEVPTYLTLNNGVASPDFRPSPAFSKILFKLHNLQQLSITPFLFENRNVPRFSKSILKSLEVFLKVIFDNLTSSKIKQLCIWNVGRNTKILRLIFDLVNNCFALSNLETMKLGTYGYWSRSDVSIHKFAEELVDSLKLRQKASHRALPRIEIIGRALFPKNCIEKAALVGTQIVQYE